MKSVSLCLLCVFTCALLYSQSSKLPNALLWRITGKSLTKPCYLFGTMHLTDKKVFQLSDSLYKSIEETEGFAAELDMNRVGMQMVNYVIADKEARAATEAIKVKDVVSAEVWEKYKDELQRKFYKSADKITVEDLEDLESSLDNDLFTKGDMPTFLDAYLFGIARKQGKWVGGLEELQDQVEHLSMGDIEAKIQVALFDDKYYRSGLDDMIKLYTAQKLDSIDALMYREANGRKDYIMTKRNLKMANMMDSLSSVRSTFFAIGAAHLPGDSGVIALLQKKGFTVTPVISAKKISPDKYVVKSKEVSWTPVIIKDSVYSVEMPGMAESIEMLESMGLDLKMYFDISLMKVYMTIGTELSASRKKLGMDSLYSAMRNRILNKAKGIKEKKITINGIEGKEFIGTTDDGELRMQVFLPDMAQLVLNAVFSPGKKALNDDETDRFLQSFIYYGIKKKALEPDKAWEVLNYPNHLFSIEMPSKPREAKDVNSQEGMIIHTYQFVDVKNQAFYGMSITSVKEGVSQLNLDSLYFISIKESLKMRLEESKVLDSSFGRFNGHPGYSVVLSGKSQGEIIETKVITVLRGNRFYYVYVVYTPGNENKAAAERFLGSFRIIPRQPVAWKTITVPDTSFTVFSPVSPKNVKPDIDDFHWDAERYLLYDSIIASTVYIDRTRIPAWFWYSSDSSFLRKRADWYKKYNDTIVGYTITTKANGAIADFTVTKKGGNLVKKVKLLLNGSELFEVFGDFDPLDLTNGYGRIFDQFKLQREGAPVERSRSKIARLAQVLEQADAQEAKRVGLWWHSLEFSKDDLPHLQKMLLKQYPDFDSVLKTGINRQLFDAIRPLDSMHSTVDFIKMNYNSIAPEDEPIKSLAINYLAGVHTAGSYAVLKDILVNRPLKTNQLSLFIYKLFDSLKLTAALYPELLKYADSKELGPRIQKLTRMLLDSGLIHKKVIIDNSRKFVGYARMMLDTEKESINQYGYQCYDCIHMLGIINSPEANSLLARFAKLDNRGIRYRTLIAQLRNNQQVDSRTIYTMASTDEYREDLYIDLKKINKSKLFPVFFLSQQDLGKSRLYALASSPTNPAALTDAGERVVDFKGEQKKFYLYRISTDGFGSGLRLGIAGPYSLDHKVYTSTHEATGIYWEEQFDNKKLDTFFKDYMSSLDERKKRLKELEEIPPPPLILK